MSMPRGRTVYSTVSSLEGNNDGDHQINDASLENDEPPVQPLASLVVPRISRSYRRVAVVDDADISSSLSDVERPSAPTTSEDEGIKVPMADPLTASVKAEENHIQVTVLDPAQVKFRVSANPDWTVLEFKQVGEAVHKVPPGAQRLIYRGKMLTDDKKLCEFGIIENDCIVHLFPKPKVVVASSNASESQQQQASHQVEGGAHVPRIVLDPREAEQRSSILVLGSEEVVEAQNNVKLFSFMLLIICAMELLALFTLMLGDPDDGMRPVHSHNHTTSIFDDAVDPNSPYPYDPNEQFEPRTWQNTDYIDLVISAFGFYVATLGIKASTENTLSLAKAYLIGTIIVGCAWNAFYFFLNVQAEEKISQQRQEEQSLGDFLTQAFFAILLPCAVWILCCLRALQFHNLIQEAEVEAAERIRAELDLEQGSASPRNPILAPAFSESSGLAMQIRSVT